MISFRICRFFSSLSLHPYLESSLQKRGLLPLKPFQLQALSIAEKQNFFLNSCTGSGKTLAYLVPICNAILHQQDAANSSAGQIPQEKKQHGAVVLTLNKELVAQVYNEVKLIDWKKRIRVFRTGSLSQTIGRESEEGVIGPFNWKSIDLLIATPQALWNQLNLLKGHKSGLNPEYVAIDEADLLLELDKNVSRHTDRLLTAVRKESTNSKNIKYLMTASSFPKKYKRDESNKQLSEYFKTLAFIEGTNRHKLSPTTEIYYVEIEGKQEDKIEQQKLSYLDKIIKDRKGQRIIIFCNERANIQVVSHHLKEKLSKTCVEYYAQLRTEERTSVLTDFATGNAEILISSQLGARGLDFALPVDCVIEYDMAENVVGYLNRAGRTARNGLKGEIITLVTERNRDLFEHLRLLQRDNLQLDELFSRKRSYSKSHKA